MAKAVPVRDLHVVEQVAEKCPEGTPAPYEQWVRLQFCPKNPRTKVAAQYKFSQLLTDIKFYLKFLDKQ